MFYDLLVHVDLPDESRFVMALGNINNYLAALNGEPCAMKKVPITKEDLLPCVEVVPAGVVEIVRLQREDFAYIKP